jgi:hypothetical protein
VNAGRAFIEAPDCLLFVGSVAVLSNPSKNSHSLFQSLKAAVGFGDQERIHAVSTPEEPQGSLTERLHQMIADLDEGERLYQERLEQALKKAG